MSEHPTFKLVQIVGTSAESLDDAIKGGIERASTTLRGVDWFQVDEIRGRVSEGSVAQFQVVMRVGFRLDGDEA